MTASPPLAGIRVVTFTTAFAGPTAARYLADLGAEVIKVESRRRWDNTRHASSAGTGTLVEPSGAPTAPGFGYFNRNTLGAAVDLSHEKGRDLVRRLIGLSDVVIENFSFQVLRKWGFSYESLKQLKPDIILLDMQGMGQTGPLKEYISFGPTLHSYSGLTSLWGYSHSSFVDYVAAQHAVLAVLAALFRRRRTGQGTHIDLAQLETAAGMLGVPYLDYFANGVVERQGDGRDQWDAPRGCYRCQGEDAWCVIEVTGDEEWRRLRKALGQPAWAGEARFDSAAGRLANQHELDTRLNAWTESLSDLEAERRLQEAGVPASAVRAAWEVFDHPQLAARDFYWNIDHPVMGSWKYPGLTIRLSDSPEPPRHPAPMLGQHNDYIFGELLGLSAEERRRLTEEGVLA